MDVDGNDRCKVGITAIIRITLLDGCYHEDVGYGQAENIRGKGAALEKVGDCVGSNLIPRPRRKP